MRTLCFDQPFVNKNLDENNSDDSSDFKHCSRLACCIRLYACQLLLALASEISARSEPFNSAPNKIIFNLSLLSLGL